MMVQWDESYHQWLGPGGPVWTLMAAIDDADNRLVGAVLAEYEGSVPYLRLLDEILQRCGIPICLYQDRHEALSRNDGLWSLEEQLEGRQSPTQVGKALEELQIEPMFAGSPQAKGRVERFFGVAQDRLVAELAAARIEILDQANDYLQKVWLPAYNRRFGKRPAQPGSTYRPIRSKQRHKILSLRYRRTVFPDNTIQLGSLVLQLSPGPRRRTWAKTRVDVRQHLDGGWSVYHQDQCIVHHPATPLGEPEQVLLKSSANRMARATSDLQVYFLPNDLETPQQPLEPL
jgi:hypothetical protein